MIIKAIVWDIGGVLLEDPMVEDFWKDKSESKELRELFGRGHLSKKEFIKKGSSLLGLSKDKFLNSYSKAYFSIKKIYAVFKLFEMTKGLNYIFSDTNPLHTEFVRKRYPEIFSLARKSFLSHEINKRKGDQEAYRRVISDLNLKPEEILLIDNKQEVLDSAKKEKIQTFLYRDPEELERELKSRKLLPMVNTIIFDFGGVISTWDPFTRVSENFEKKYKIKKERLYDLLKANDNEYLLGNISTKNFWEKTVKKEGISYDEFYNEISLFKLNPIMIKLIKNLKENYELVLLSDCYESIHNRMKEDITLNTLFKKEFYSDTLHLSKAIHGVKMFSLVLKQIKKKPEECIFIDDKIFHVNNASKTGIDSIYFKNVKQLKKDLIARNITF